MQRLKYYLLTKFLIRFYFLCFNSYMELYLFFNLIKSLLDPTEKIYNLKDTIENFN